MSHSTHNVSLWSRVSKFNATAKYLHRPRFWQVVSPAESQWWGQRSSWLDLCCHSDRYVRYDVHSPRWTTACHSWWRARRQKCQGLELQRTWQPGYALGRTWSLTALPRAHAVHGRCMSHSPSHKMFTMNSFPTCNEYRTITSTSSKLHELLYEQQTESTYNKQTKQCGSARLQVEQSLICSIPQHLGSCGLDLSWLPLRPIQWWTIVYALPEWEERVYVVGMLLQSLLLAVMHV